MIVAIISLIIIINILILCFYTNMENFVENINLATFNPESVNFPFKNLKTNNGKILKIIAITAPFRSDEHKMQYSFMKDNGYSFLGVSSYLEFPGIIYNPHEDPYYNKNKDDYFNMTKAWLHCFRFPNDYIPKHIPKMLLSESDFTNINHVKPNENQVKEYDLIYVCLNDSDEECVEGWQAYNRNWTLAKKCLSLLCEKFNLKILIVGRTKCTIKYCNSNIQTIPFQLYWDFLGYMKKAKVLFVPNISDASPRVITEALSCDLRILVNYGIVGGWKYINEHTGEYFNDENDFMDKLIKVFQHYNNYKPREWLVENFGYLNSGKKLLGFLKENYPEVDFYGAEYVTF
jgi:hypothetical protein